MDQITEFFIDKDPTDWEKVILHQKPDRQIAASFIFACWYAGYLFFMGLKISVRLIVVYIEKKEKREEEIKKKLQERIDKAKADKKKENKKKQ